MLEAVDWLDWPKRSSHMPRLHVGLSQSRHGPPLYKDAQSRIVNCIAALPNLRFRSRAKA